MEHKLSKQMWFGICLFSFMGGIAWNIENMYFNTFLYNSVYAGASSAAMAGTMAPTTAIIAAQRVIFAYDFVRALAVTAGIVNSDNSNTIPIMRIANTMVMETMIVSRYEAVRDAMPWLAENLRSNARYITGRHHRIIHTTQNKVNMPNVIISCVVTVTMLPNI